MTSSLWFVDATQSYQVMLMPHVSTQTLFWIPDSAGVTMVGSKLHPTYHAHFEVHGKECHASSQVVYKTPF